MFSNLRVNNLIGCVLFLLCLSGVSAQQVSAVEQNSRFLLTVEPAFQELEIPENVEIVTTTITFTNHTTEPLELELFARDFKHNDQLGSIAFLENLEEQYPHTLVPYLTFEKNRVVIAPQSAVDVVVRITNRSNLSPGGHYAAVLARTVADAGQQKQILPAVSSLLLVRKLGGEQFHLSLAKSMWQPDFIVFSIPQKIDLLFSNEGNVHEIPRGTVTFKDIFDRVVAQGTVNVSSLYVLPGTLRRIPIEVTPSRFMFPIMFVEFEIQGTGQISKSPYAHQSSFIFVDYRLLWAVAFITTTLVAVHLWKRRSKKRHT